MKKVQFTFDGKFCEFAENGEYELPIESELLHRFVLEDGVVVDKYDGITDHEVRVLDHEAATKAALENVDLDGNPDPLTPPPPLEELS